MWTCLRYDRYMFQELKLHKNVKSLLFSYSSRLAKWRQQNVYSVQKQFKFQHIEITKLCVLARLKSEMKQTVQL
jgi:hypothetical protein